MRRTNVSAWVYLLIVFAGGAGLGAVADRLYTARSVAAKQDPRQRYIEELRGHLKLSQDQTSKLSAILDATDQKMKDLHERDRPEMTAIHKQQVAQVQAILTEPQRAEYNRMRAERQKRREAEEKSREKNR